MDKKKGKAKKDIIGFVLLILLTGVLSVVAGPTGNGTADYIAKWVNTSELGNSNMWEDDSAVYFTKNLMKNASNVDIGHSVLPFNNLYVSSVITSGVYPNGVNFLYYGNTNVHTFMNRDSWTNTQWIQYNTITLNQTIIANLSSNGTFRTAGEIYSGSGQVCTAANGLCNTSAAGWNISGSNTTTEYIAVVNINNQNNEGLIINGAASQNKSYFIIKDSSGNTKFLVDKSGQLGTAGAIPNSGIGAQFGGTAVRIAATSSIGRLYFGTGDQGAIVTGANSLSIDSYGGSGIGYIDVLQQSGIYVGTGTDTPTAIWHINNQENSAAVVQKIQGIANQTADLTQYLNSSGSIIASVSTEGYFNPGECAGSYSEGDICYNSTAHILYVYNGSGLQALN